MIRSIKNITQTQMKHAVHVDIPWSRLPWCRRWSVNAELLHSGVSMCSPSHHSVCSRLWTYSTRLAGDTAVLYYSSMIHCTMHVLLLFTAYYSRHAHAHAHSLMTHSSWASPLRNGLPVLLNSFTFFHADEMPIFKGLSHILLCGFDLWTHKENFFA